MVRIPLIRRRQKPDSPHDEDGNGKDSQGKKQPSQSPAVVSDTNGAVPAMPSGRDPEPVQYVLGTDKKVRLPGKKSSRRERVVGLGAEAVEQTPSGWKLPEKDATPLPPEVEFVARVNLPETLPVASKPTSSLVENTIGTGCPEPAEAPPAAHETGEKQDAAQNPLASGSESSGPAKEANGPAAAASSQDSGPAEQGLDLKTVLQAIPDFIFRIGPSGVVSLVGGGGRTGAGIASGSSGGAEHSDAHSTASGNNGREPLEKIILEELSRQQDPHTRKVLETKELQAFEFQVRDDKEVHYLEARLNALDEGAVLALVRDVTLLRQTQNALVESRNELENHLKERNAELIRVNKMLKTEVGLREEQEAVLKKNFRRLEGLLEDTIGAITLIVERRDPHVADHQRRVSQLACAIGQEMKLRSDEMRAVRMAAQLHDLGQIFIPAEILRKPSKLTAAEMAVVQTHPDTDYQILKRIDFPISIADIVRQHHERMDGSGYPQGLKGDNILPQARILAVADVIEGMVFERPYRVAPGLEAALKEIADKKGVLYDPAVADACLKLFAEERFKFEPSPAQESAKNAGDREKKPLVSVGPAPDRRDL